MALVFGAATSDRVSHGRATSLNNLDPFTYVVKAFVTTRTSLRTFMGKNVKALRLSGTTGNIELVVGRSPTNTDYISTGTPISTNIWTTVAATFSSGASPTGHMYTGTNSVTMAEVNYGTTTAGSGTLSDDSTHDLGVGNVQGDAPSIAIQGRIAWAMVYNRVLSLGELRILQYSQVPLSGCVLFTHYGHFGTATQPDWSGTGNNGTVTGATVGAHDHSLLPYVRRGPWQPYFLAQAGGGGGGALYLPSSMRSLMGVGI